MAVLSLLFGDRMSAIALCVLVQCTVSTVLACLVSLMGWRNAAFRETMLKMGMICALVCPFVTVGLDMVGATWLTVPVTESNLAWSAKGTGLTSSSHLLKALGWLVSILLDQHTEVGERPPA